MDKNLFPVRRAPRVAKYRGVVAILGFALALFAAPLLAADRFALVIGNGDYEHASSLPNPANDANLVASRLQELDFDVELLLDAGITTLRERVVALGDRAVGAEMIVVFYAGHGVQLQGANYLLPTDARITSRADVPASSLQVAEIYEQFNRAEPAAAVLILDACRDNPFVSAIDTDNGLTSGSVSARAFVQRPNAAGMLIAFAAAPGATAADGVDGNSPFTTALAQWMHEPSMDLTTMFRRVRATVLKLTSGQQIPWVEEALVREVYLNPAPPPQIADSSSGVEAALLQTIAQFENGSERDAAEVFYDRYLQRTSFDPDQAPEPSPQQADDQFVQEGLIWMSIRSSNNPEAFEAFLKNFPDSVFSQLAEKKLEQLESGPVPEALTWLDTLDPISVSVDTGAPEAPATTGGGLAATMADAISQPPAAPALGTTTVAEAAPAVPDAAVPPSPAELEERLGLSGDELRAVQVLLKEVDAYTGGIDGAYGPGTRGGISAFQRSQVLNATGYLNMETLRALVSKAAPALLKSDRAGDYADDIHRVAAVAARGPGADVQTIRMVGIRRNDRVHEEWRRVADAFEADRPGLRVTIETPPGWQYRRDLLKYLGSDNPPDILHTWGGGHLDALREAGFARDITEAMTDGWAFEFKPGALQNYTFDDRIYGAPTHLSVVSLYANRAVLEQGGIDPASLATWEGFLQASASLKAQGITPLTVGGQDQWPFQLIYGNLAQRIGGREAIEAGLRGEGDGFLADPFLRASDEFTRLLDIDPFQTGYLDTTESDAGEFFAKGGSAMLITGSWRLNKIRWTFEGGLDAMQENLIQLPFPTVGNRPQTNVTYGGADGFAVHEDAPDATVDLLRRLTALQVQETMTDAASYVPSASGADLAVEGEWLGDAANRLLQSTHHQLFLDQLLGPSVGDVLNQELTRVATGEITGREAVAALDAAWDDVLGLQRQ